MNNIDLETKQAFKHNQSANQIMLLAGHCSRLQNGDYRERWMQ